MIWDYVYDVQTADGSVTFYLNPTGAYEDYANLQYTPTSAAVVATIWWYYENIAEPSTTSEAYLVDGSEKITSITHTLYNLTFIINAEAGKTSTTRVYCGDRGEPIDVSGEDSWSYNSTTKIAVVTVTHSSNQTIVLIWIQTTMYDPWFNTTVYVTITVSATGTIIAYYYRRKKKKHERDVS